MRKWIVDEDDETYYGTVTIRLPEPLTETEQRIVKSWFSAAEAVRLDPWFDSITNGRHRLWNTLDHFADRLVPVAGDALGYATPPDIQALGDNWHLSYRNHVRELGEVEWFDRHDQMNSRFITALEQAARGEIPAPR